MGKLTQQSLSYTLVICAQLLPENGRIDLGKQSTDEMDTYQIIQMIEIISNLTEESKLMQKIAQRHQVLKTVSEIFQSKWV